jgi:hypothetical protein
MANTIITHQAQKLRIKSMRNSHFKLVVNIKNADGGDYDFTSDTTDTTLGDTGYLRIYQNNGANLYLSLAAYEQTQSGGGGGAVVQFMNVTTEDGKITIEWDNESGFPYAPWPGKYQYTLYTKDANNKYYVWLHGDWVVEDQNISIGGITFYDYIQPDPEPEPEEEEQVP